MKTKGLKFKIESTGYKWPIFAIGIKPLSREFVIVLWVVGFVVGVE